MQTETLGSPSSQAVPLSYAQTECPLSVVHGDSSLLKIADAFGAGPFEHSLFGIRQCRQCGLGLTSPIPPPEAASGLYADRASNDFQPGDTGFVSHLKAFFARKDAAHFARYSGEARTVLDYACGNGAFTVAMSQVLPSARSFGCDYHDVPPSGIRPESYLSYLDLAQYRSSFDLIIARHVLEHTYDPVNFLRELGRLTASRGVLAIEVPSLDTPWRRVFGKHWDGYYVPYHPLHFTKRSLALAVEAAGFEVLRMGTAEMPKMGRSLRNVVGGPYTPLLFAAGVVLQPAQVLAGLLTRTSVCLRVWARKR